MIEVATGGGDGQDRHCGEKPVEVMQVRATIRTAERWILHRWHTPDRSLPWPLRQRACQLVERGTVERCQCFLGRGQDGVDEPLEEGGKLMVETSRPPVSS
jgi:hypothetical protein